VAERSLVKQRFLHDLSNGGALLECRRARDHFCDDQGRQDYCFVV
jgi:hypothetical protein